MKRGKIYNQAISIPMLILSLLLILPGLLPAQSAIFLSEGRIEFEKKLNLYAQFEDEGNFSDMIKKTLPNFKTTYFNLSFHGNTTSYGPGKENPENNRLSWDNGPAEDNVIFSDLEANKMISQKKVFEQTFLISDSTRKIAWKITDEHRTIAGFDCRRANALIMDSIYVVAFFTEEIITPGGPESFSGLPGMILGIALPHQHVSWFATRVERIPVQQNALTVPQKGKKMNNAELHKTLQDLMKDWGQWGRRNMQAILL